MNRCLAAVVILSCLVNPGPLMAAGNPGHLHIMTFNIRYNNPGDSIYSWDARKNMVMEVIRSENPDVFCLQEVLAGQLAEIDHRFGDYRYCGVGRDDGKESGEFAPVFFRESRYKKLDGSTFWLSETPGVPGSRSWEAACNRIVTWVCLSDRKTNDTLFVFNTHFDHASQKAREESATLLVERIRSICHGKMSFVTGDFNETKESRMYQILNGALFPAASFAEKVSDPGYTFIGFPFHPAPGEEIDFIFVNFKTDARFYRVIEDHTGERYPSDHLPVAADILYKN